MSIKYTAATTCDTCGIGGTAEVTAHDVLSEARGVPPGWHAVGSQSGTTIPNAPRFLYCTEACRDIGMEVEIQQAQERAAESIRYWFKTGRFW